MNRLKPMAVLVSATLLLVPLGTTAAGADSACWTVKRSERRFAQRINEARTSRGRVRLSLDPEASKAARVHAREMANRDTLYHTPANTLGWRVTRWYVLGENVGVGGDVPSLHRAFMNSAPHRENVLYPSFRHLGVGVVTRGDTMWVTMIFESRYDPGTRLRMRC